MTQSGTTVDELDDAPATIGARARAAALVPLRLLGALFLPDRVLPRQVGAGRYGWAVIVLVVCGLLGAGAVGLRLDTSSDVLRAAAGSGRRGPGGGDGGGGPQAGGPGGGSNMPAGKSDREIAEEIGKKLAVERTMRALVAGVWFPFKFVVLFGIVCFFLLRFVGGNPTFERTLAATAHAALPFAVQSLVLGVAALSQASLTPAQADALTMNPAAGSTPGPVELLLFSSGLNVFNWWSVVILGFGLAAAGEITRKRAFAAVAWFFVLYLGIGVAQSDPPGGDKPHDKPRGSQGPR